MGKLKDFFSMSNYCGAGRAQSEKESEIAEMEDAIKHNHRDADVCQKRLDQLRSEKN